MLDLINSIYAFLVVFLLFLAYRIPAKYFLFISAHLILVFLTNNILFPAEYMPDQFRYIHSASNIRESGFDLSTYRNFDINYSATVSNSALFFALFPIPFLDSIYSIAIINFMIYSLIFIYLYKREIFTDTSIWIYLLFPSCALYAAIGGRDILIFYIMVLSFIYAIRGNFMMSLVLASPLLLIKYQNFILIFISLLVFFVIKNFYKKKFIKFILSFCLAFGIFAYALTIISIDELNVIRLSMFREDGGLDAEYVPLNSWLDAIKYGFFGVFYTFLYPLPWDVNGPLQLIQLFENIIIFIIIFTVCRRLIKLNSEYKYLLFIYLASHAAVYGLIVSNYGSLARYKFSFILIFIIFSLKLIHEETVKIRNSYLDQ